MEDEKESLRAKTNKEHDRDWVTRKINPVSEINTTIQVRNWVAMEKSPSSEAEKTFQPISSEAESDTETVTVENHTLPDAEASGEEEQASETKTGAEQEAAEEVINFAGNNNSADYDGIADFEVDQLSDDSSEEEIPTLQEVYQRCQTIRRKRFYADIYNVWQQKVQDEEAEEAIKTLAACGFDRDDSDALGDGLDTALSLVPERFWKNETSAMDISIEHLKMMVEEKKDAVERAHFREHCMAAESAQSGKTGRRRAAIATGGGRPSAVLNDYLEMNLLTSHVPMYYFPSYLSRFKAAMMQHDSKAEESAQQ